MNDLSKLGLIVVGVIGFLLYINLLCAIIAWWSGWRELAKRFGHPWDSRSQVGGLQSARFRWGCNYNNAFRLSADEIGLGLCALPIVPQHPPLLIPWNEIQFEERKKFLWFTFLTFRLGSSERIPFTISDRLAFKIEHSPGVPPSLIPHNE